MILQNMAVRVCVFLLKTTVFVKQLVAMHLGFYKQKFFLSTLALIYPCSNKNFNCFPQCSRCDILTIRSNQYELNANVQPDSVIFPIEN